MAYSRVTKIGDGVTTQFPVNFSLGYLDQSHITARVGTEVDGLGQPVYRAITFLSPSLMQIAGTPAGIGVKVLFERTIKKDELIVNFSNGDVMDEVNLDTAQKQSMMAVQEVLDGRFGVLTQDLDFGGYTGTNTRAPVSNGDLTNKLYVDTAVSTLDDIAVEIAQLAAIRDSITNVSGIDAEVVTVAGISSDIALLADNSALLSGTAGSLYMSENIFTGNSSTTVWTLSSAPASPANVDVWVGGSIQRQSDYTVSGTSLTITPAVSMGVQIIAKVRLTVSANDMYAARDTAVSAAAAALAYADACAAYATVTQVADITALRAVNVSTFNTAIVRSLGRAGVFVWRTGDFASAVALDTYEGIYVKATSTAANLGAWVRSYDSAIESMWFGVVGNGSFDDGTALDKSFAMAILLGRQLHYSGSLGSTFKRTTPHLMDMAGAATQGIIVSGDGVQRSRIDVRTVASSPQAMIYCSGGFIGATITALSGTGTTATVVWSNSITPAIGSALELSGCSTPGYNGTWYVLTSGPGTATFACAATGSPVTKGIITQRVIQANASFVNFGFLTSTANTGLMIGTHDFSDQLNRTEFNLTVTNDINAGTSRAVEINALYHCYARINAVLGGTIVAGSAAIAVRQAGFSLLELGGGNADRGIHITDGFTYGNKFEIPDSEVVNYAFVIDSIHAQDNLIDVGTLGFTTYGVIATAGNNNKFDNSNRNSAAPMFHPNPAFRVGVVLETGEHLGYNGTIEFGNLYRKNVVVNNVIVAGGTLAAPAERVARTVVWTALGTAATLTITLPSSPEEGAHVEFFFIYAVTALTVAGGTAVGGNPSSVAAQSTLAFTYVGGNWYRF